MPKNTYFRIFLTLFSIIILIGHQLLENQAIYASSHRPNIVVILADDLGWNDVGWHGSEIKTPNLDNLATLALRLERFYVKPTCTPTRAAFLTGRHPYRYGITTPFNVLQTKIGLPLEEKTIAETFKKAGYYTAVVGKWHLGFFEESYLPTNRGFDYHYGHYTGAIHYFNHTRMGGLDWHRNTIHLEENGYSTDLIGADAVRLINNHDYQKQPLFLYVAFNAAHTPFQAKEKDIQEYLTIEDENRRIFAAQVQSMDEAIGNIVKALKNQNIWDNTFLIFTSDNGGAIKEDGRGDNRPLKDGKGSLYEGGVRVPTLLSYPVKFPKAKEINQIFSIVDLYPTLANLAGINLDSENELDGIDIVESILQKSTERDELLIQYRGPTRAAIIKDNYKLILNGEQNSPYYGTVELFNLETDPLETHNLAYAKPKKVKKLTKILEAYQQNYNPSKIDANWENPEDFIPPKIWSPEFLR